MMVGSYKNLIVWNKSVTLAQEVYKISGLLPKEEICGLTSQMRRAAVSIPSNIAEGSKRKDLPEYLQFLRVSAGSAAELETQIILLNGIYPSIKTSELLNLNQEIQKMLYVMISKLKPKTYNP